MSDQISNLTFVLFRERQYKRVFDLSLLVVAHLLPFMVPIWILLWILIPLAIKLEDGGPVFYRQKRIGKRGSTFEIIKFRTMTFDAEKHTGAVWSVKNDQRITTVGRLLRWTALDELPQIVNILKGDMSLVGPRPERPELHEKIVSDLTMFDQRLNVRPGLTGLAQINGAYDLSPSQKLDYDLEYMRKMGLVLDIKILLLSVVMTLRAKWDQPQVANVNEHAQGRFRSRAKRTSDVHHLRSK